MAKLNLFATSSHEGFLRALKAPDGHVIVGNDINSLEPHVLAHYSQDPGYMKIYAKGADPNCIYLYLGAHSPQHGHLFREVYDPENPTKEQVSIATSQYKNERQRYKVCVLALAYEGTEVALGRMFKKFGIDVSISELRQLVRLFKRTFPGLPEFRDKLQAEWHHNGGYILTGAGRPLGVPRDKIKDIIAFFCQTTGHDFVLRWIYHMNQYRIKHKLRARPFLPDYHDATYWVCPDTPEDIEATKTMMYYAYDRLNEELDLSVSFAGECKVGYDMTIK